MLPTRLCFNFPSARTLDIARACANRGSESILTRGSEKIPPGGDIETSRREYGCENVREDSRATFDVLSQFVLGDTVKLAPCLKLMPEVFLSSLVRRKYFAHYPGKYARYKRAQYPFHAVINGAENRGYGALLVIRS